jgi:hypothetical protein
VNRQDGVARVIGIEEEAAQLGFGEGGGEGVESLHQVLIHTLALLTEFQENLDLVAPVLETGEKGKILLQTLLVLIEGLGPFLVLPDLGGGKGAVYGFEVGRFAVEVKENPGSLRIFGSGRRPGT